MGVGRGVWPQLLGDRERTRTTSTGRAARTAKRTMRARLGLRRSLGESSYLPLIRAGVVASDNSGLFNKPTALASRPVNHYRDPVHPRNVAGSYRKSLPSVSMASSAYFKSRLTRGHYRAGTQLPTLSNALENDRQAL